ncbi:adenosylcobinamide-GDP ribazoletransferase [Motilibacter aurantiacus]|uniref:adenosylcobinamide-GDP ribazoletransferase n=1 Tax=Motilibacter aurantiacus TaxID=2714955 RepID=UPI00140A6141|nr:adenosylcobinamide-GDP ribazoletransferase [Motilibacter aurantiacus]
MSTAGDALRLAVGTFSVVRVPAPRRVDAAVASGAMLLGPLVGAGLGGVAALALLAVDALDGPPLLGAAAALAALAGLTRGLHLDGLADTADGLGSGRPAPGALEVMKRSDIGPFGVVTLVLVLLADAAALAAAPTTAVVVAAVTGRAAVTLACRRGVPSARAGGLGATVAGTVPVAGALLVAAAAVGLGGVLLGARGASAAAGGLLAGLALLARCRRRFGGVTGDVLGALVETSTAVSLAVLALGSR